LENRCHRNSAAFQQVEAKSKAADDSSNDSEDDIRKPLSFDFLQKGTLCLPFGGRPWCWPPGAGLPGRTTG